MKAMWDNRYSAEEYAYGTNPNEFFSSVLEKITTEGKVLFPAEGEGRNAVYAAKNGLKVTAFDTSVEGRKKALKLADKENVEIKYQVGDLFDLDIIDKQYDAAVLVFAHFPPPVLSKYHRKIGDLVKPNGLIILEGFSKNHLKFREKNPTIGGPNKAEMLFSKDSIVADFPDFEIIQLEEIEVELTEGKYHNGVGSVIRFIGKKRTVI